MTKEDIIRMARESDEYADSVFPSLHRPLGTHWTSVRDQRFAELVAAAEREACAQICNAASEPRNGYGQTDEQWAASTLAERIRARSNP